MAAERTLQDVGLYLQRTRAIERIVLFVKLAVILFALSVILLDIPLTTQLAPGDEIEPGSSQEFFFRSIQFFKLQVLLYAVGNGIFWFCLFVLGRRIAHYAFIKTTAFFLVIIDIVFVTLLIWLQPELRNTLFWLYCFVLIHAVLLFPDAPSLALLTAITAVFYVGAVSWNVAQPDEPSTIRAEDLAREKEQERRALALNVIILVLAGAGCWGGNTIIQMRLRALGENQERVIRTEKLNVAALMASSIAHELKNPLAIMNNAAYILRRGHEKLDDKLRSQLDVITSEIQRSDKIITDLLGYAKFAHGKIERVHVNRLLDEALNDLTNEIANRQITVTRAYTRHLPPLLIDRTQCRTIIANLLLNACEAIDTLGTITIATNYSDDGFIEIAIADTGKGIAEKDLAKVFDSFFTTKSAGTGLGLSIVNSIAKAYGGTIAVESKPDKGTRFTVRLPTRTARAQR